MTSGEAHKIAFNDIAFAHPHETEEAYPDEFWEYFHEKFPNIPRDKMKAMLKKTREK